MSGRWPPESKAKNASSLRDEHHGAMEDTDMAVGEEDVAELCKMEIWTVKNMIRPDTLRIGTSFNEMMAAVKVRLKGSGNVCPLREPYRKGCATIYVPAIGTLSHLILSFYAAPFICTPQQ